MNGPEEGFQMAENLVYKFVSKKRNKFDSSRGIFLHLKAIYLSTCCVCVFMSVICSGKSI